MSFADRAPDGDDLSRHRADPQEIGHRQSDPAAGMERELDRQRLRLFSRCCEAFRTLGHRVGAITRACIRNGR